MTDFIHCCPTDLGHLDGFFDVVRQRSVFGPSNVFLLCSKVLPTEIRRVLVDYESYGARSLGHILLPAQMGVRPDFIRSDVSLNPREFDFDADPHEAYLLVGENALLANHSKFRWIYDLGKGWHGLTSSPFVFHVWACRRGVDLKGVEKELADTVKMNIQGADDYISKERDRLHVGAGLEVIFKRILRTECGPAEISALRHYVRELMRAQVVKGASQFQVYRPPVAAGMRARAYHR